MEKEKIVAVFKAFSDVNRVEILALLKDGEMCGNDILEKMEISQSTLSHHMKILCESGIVNGRKEGKWTYYAISEDGGVKARALLDEILDAVTANAEGKTETKVKIPTKKAAENAPKKAVKKSAEKEAAEPAKISDKKKTEKTEPGKEACREKQKEQETAPRPQKPKRRQMDSWLL